MNRPAGRPGLTSTVRLYPDLTFSRSSSAGGIGLASATIRSGRELEIFVSFISGRSIEKIVRVVRRASSGGASGSVIDSEGRISTGGRIIPRIDSMTL